MQEPMGARDVFIPTTKPNFTMIFFSPFFSFFLFHTASSATFCVQLLQKGICCGWHVKARHMHVQTELKWQWSSEVANKSGISSCDASSDSCIWNVRGTSCRGKKKCRHASLYGLDWRLLLLLKTFPHWPHTLTWAFTVHECLPGSRLLLCAKTFCTSHT